jgi:hypothetical protein
MLQPTIITWIIIIFGFITCIPLFYAQLVLLMQPNSKKARDLMIGKGENWRDKTHFRSALGAAWADWVVELPLLISGTVGIIFGFTWGYVLYGAAGAIQVYINTILWFQEKGYVYPSHGPLAYYTYYWGNFIYWGTASVIYALLRLNGITI